MSEAVVQKIGEMHKRIHNLIKENNSNFETRFIERDLSLLKKSLEFFRRWSSLLNKIRSYAGANCVHDSTLISITEFLPQVKSYEERKDAISEMLRKTRDDFNEVNFINHETERFETQRDSFFEKINTDLELMLQAKCLVSFQLDAVDVNSLEKTCLDSLKLKINVLLGSVEQLVNKLVKEEQLNKNEYDKLNVSFGNLVSIKKNVKLSNRVRSLKCLYNIYKLKICLFFLIYVSLQK